MDDQGDDARARARELYWTSELSVNQIAEELGLSKGTLYAEIRPEGSGRACPQCAHEVSFPNRTSRDRGEASCPGCGWTGPVEALSEAVPEHADAEYRSSRSPEAPPSAFGGGARPTGYDDRFLVGIALVGMAAGIALATLVRRR
ncbi:MAG: hypothetical protein OEZ65_12370 [Gemmatimonadota bacterium]|nr:hypothetical protein [Gemmatimonadota bacterium]MDH5760375.1 hypothetical protein [Gemmatimonadota bacterium]